MKLRRSWLIPALPLALLAAPLFAHAVSLLPPCTATGDCGVSDILAVGVNFAEFLLGISGAVALGFFVWGGFQMVLAAGNQEKVKQGFETLRNAVIGIVIIFMSGALVQFTKTALTGNNKTVAAVGDPCDNGAGIMVEVPAGTDSGGNVIAEGLKCMDNCGQLQGELKNRNRADASTYGCYATDDPGVSSCVRGLCSGTAAYACCSCPNGGCTSSGK